MSAFSEFGVMPELIHAVQDLGWTLPTDVQAESIPLILGGGDVLIAAETGSGKTGAFGLPLLQIVHEILSTKTMPTTPTTTTSASAAIMNDYDRDITLDISPDGLTCQSSCNDTWTGGRCTYGLLKSKHYYEVEVLDKGGFVRIGWSTMAAKFNLGTNRLGFGYGSSGKKVSANKFVDYGDTFTQGDVIGCYLDLKAKVVSFSKNGKPLGIAFEIPTSLHLMALYPTVSLKNSRVRFNFGDVPFRSPPSDDYVGVAEAETEQIFTFAKCNRKPVALVILPSTDLATQICNQLSLFKKRLPPPNIEETLFIGDVAIKKCIKVLEKGVDVIIGTPSRIFDLASSGKIDISAIKLLILDEADAVLRGPSEMLTSLFVRNPQVNMRPQIIMCSATLHSNEVQLFAKRIMHSPTWVDLKGANVITNNVHSVIAMADVTEANQWHDTCVSMEYLDNVHNGETNLSEMDKLSQSTKFAKAQVLLKLLNANNIDRALIFARTQLDCENVAKFLNFHNKKSASIHAKCDIQNRTKLLKQFKEGSLCFIVSTDIAARGIDVAYLPCVINYTLPQNATDFQHRIGRVGRSENMGLAVSIVSKHKEKVWYHTCKTRNSCINRKSCCIWYNEIAILADIQRLYGETFPCVSNQNFVIPVDEIDGAVVYGKKRNVSKQKYVLNFRHDQRMKDLAILEEKAQLSFFSLKRKFIVNEII